MTQTFLSTLSFDSSHFSFSLRLLTSINHQADFSLECFKNTFPDRRHQKGKPRHEKLMFSIATKTLARKDVYPPSNKKQPSIDSWTRVSALDVLHNFNFAGTVCVGFDTQQVGPLSSVQRKSIGPCLSSNIFTCYVCAVSLSN